jgi:ankyrin repeat protein
MIAHNLTNDRGERCFADFNAFLRVNRALCSCLNLTLWKSAMECSATTARVLTHLIRSNNLASLKHFLELGVDITNGEIDQPTVLITAAYLDNISLARRLLENGVKVDHEKPQYSALHAARSAEMVQLLLDHHADPEQEDGNLHQPLHRYAMRGDIAAMRASLQHGIDVDLLTSWDRTPLHEARGIDAAMLLLEFGADAKKKDLAGNTPLHFAARTGDTDVVRLLVEHWPGGMREKNQRKNTPLHLAARDGRVEVVRILVGRWPEGMREKNRFRDTPLHLAAAEGRTDVVRVLVERWPEGTKEKNKYGDTPLHAAAAGGRFRGKADVVGLFGECCPEGKEGLNEHRQTPLSVFEDHAERKELIALLDGVC